MKIVIVGGVAGGASAAARARRLDESAEIVLIERGAEPSFANCGMPYYIGGEIERREKLLVAPIDLLRDRLRLDVRVRQEAISIDRAGKSLRVRRLDDGSEYEEAYDKLILSPGAAPTLPSIDGIDSPRIHTLRNLADADGLRDAATGAASAIVVGGGFIGLEMMENLVRLGVRTTLVERNRQVVPPWDAEMVVTLAETIRDHGVDLRLGDEVTAFTTTDDGLTATLRSGTQLHADFAVMAIGVRPENKLAADAGLPIGERGGIVVNEQMQTSDLNIYAVGDAVETTHALTGDPTQIPLAGPANRQGRIAADAIFGRHTSYRGSQGTAVLRVFDKTAAMTGLSEKACQANGHHYEKVYVHPSNHAGYYPGAEPMALKLLFDPQTGSIFGAQAVGGDGVDKRIDVLATAIQAEMTVFDLEEAELCYAPQYGSAKDLVNLAGFVAAGVARGDQPVAHAEELLDGTADVV
ncbi:MAG: FAD-dependent oxidoreductase, partial [Planctomycetota bacterium]